MPNIIAGSILIIIGGFMFVFTKAMVRFQIWSQRTLMGAQYIPSRRTYMAMQLVGVLLMVLGIIISAGILI
jgi:hypothetical protein